MGVRLVHQSTVTGTSDGDGEPRWALNPPTIQIFHSTVPSWFSIGRTLERGSNVLTIGAVISCTENLNEVMELRGLS